MMQVANPCSVLDLFIVILPLEFNPSSVTKRVFIWSLTVGTYRIDSPTSQRWTSRAYKCIVGYEITSQVGHRHSGSGGKRNISES